MTLERATQLLSHAPIFSGADRAAVGNLAALGRFQVLARGEHLFREGEAVTRLYVVERGNIRVYRLARGGTRELTLHVEGSRQIVALAAAFQARASYPASAQALQAGTQVFSLPLETALDSILSTPSLARAALAYLARRQADLLQRVDQLVFTELAGRLAQYLLEHAHTPHQLPTNSELAALLGTVPELVSRKLGDFYRLGFIRLERRQVVVLELEELEKLAGGEK